MIRRNASLLLLPLLLAGSAGAVAGESPACKPPEAAVIRVRFGDSIASGDGVEGHISGSQRFGLELRELQSGALLWTAGPGPDALQQIPGMDAAILARPTPVDLNGDGWHDRIYIADVAGRIWRLDLQSGAARDDWARAQLLADLSGAGLRGFVAAPDIALHDEQGSPWLSIALGSVSLQDQPAVNRFYVLRDDAAMVHRDVVPTTSPPLSDADLRPAEGITGIGTLHENERQRGYYLSLGYSQVLAPSLTLGGVVAFTAVQLSSLQAGGCVALATGLPGRIGVQAVTARDGTIAFDLNSDGNVDESDVRLTLEGLRRPDSALRMAELEDADVPGQRSCLVGSDPIPDCRLDTRLRRRFWLREDAD